MRLTEVAEALEAKVVCGCDAGDPEVRCVGASDIVSDLLVWGKPGMLLLTGLAHPSVVRAAHLIDVAAVVFVRGRTPSEDALALARDLGLPVLLSPHSLYDCSGRLYVRGLPGVIPAQGEAARTLGPTAQVG